MNDSDIPEYDQPIYRILNRWKRRVIHELEMLTLSRTGGTSHVAWANGSEFFDDTEAVAKHLVEADEVEGKANASVIRTVAEFCRIWNSRSAPPSPEDERTLDLAMATAKRIIDARIAAIERTASGPHGATDNLRFLNPNLLPQLTDVIRSFRAGQMTHPGLHFLELNELTCCRIFQPIEELIVDVVTGDADTYGPIWDKTPHSIFYGGTKAAWLAFDGICRTFYRVLEAVDALPKDLRWSKSFLVDPTLDGAAADWMMEVIFQIAQRRGGRADLDPNEGPVYLLPAMIGNTNLFALPNRRLIGTAHLASKQRAYFEAVGEEDRPKDPRQLEWDLLKDVARGRIFVTIFDRCVFSAAATAVEIIAAPIQKMDETFPDNVYDDQLNEGAAALWTIPTTLINLAEAIGVEQTRTVKTKLGSALKGSGRTWTVNVAAAPEEYREALKKWLPRPATGAPANAREPA